MCACTYVRTYGVYKFAMCTYCLSCTTYFSWCSFYTCHCTFLQIPATMEIGLVPPLKKGQYPGLFLMTSPARMVRPVLNLATNTQEMIGSFEQVIFRFVSRLFLSSRKGPGLYSLHTCMIFFVVCITFIHPQYIAYAHKPCKVTTFGYCMLLTHRLRSD